MEFLKFDFSHPFKGMANLIRLNTFAPQTQTILNGDEASLEIQLSACQAGKLRLVIDWIDEENSFCYQENFEVFDHFSLNSLINC